MSFFPNYFSMLEHESLHSLASYFGANLAGYQKSKKILGDKQGGNRDFKKAIHIQKLFVLKMLNAPPACNSYFTCQFFGIESVNYLHHVQFALSF